MEELLSLPNVQRVLGEFAVALRNEYQDNLILHNRIASGDLLNSVEYVIDRDGYTYTVSLMLKDYWYFVENGRKAGKWPPIDNILNWIKIKPVLPRPNAEGKLPTPQQLAFLIARKIGEEGTEGTQDLRKATDTIWDTFEDRLYEAIDEDVDAAFIQIFHYL